MNLNDNETRNVYVGAVFTIQTAVNRLDQKVKPPKDDMQQQHFISAISEINAALDTLKRFIPDVPEN